MAPGLGRRLSERPAFPVAASLSLVVAATLSACAAESPPAEPGRDCQALLELAQRAGACDPELAKSLDQIRDAPSERLCRIAARKVLAPPRPRRPVRSMFDPDRPSGSSALTGDERARLAAFSLPATLVLRPDVPAGPGVPATVAELGPARMLATGAGHLEARVAPGRYTVAVGHAGQTNDHCVLLHACERLELTTHGPHLERHGQVRAGPCQSPVPSSGLSAAE